MQQFIGSVCTWFNEISVNSVIMMVMMIFMMIGGIDRICGNRLGYGKEFEEGFKTMGPLVLAVASIIAIAPLISEAIRPVILPFAKLIGADPSFIAGLLLGSDMGGYPLALELALDTASGKYNGLIVAGIMGPTITFTIPIAFSVINIKDRPFLAVGVLAGLVSVPAGCLVGGIVMKFSSYEISIKTLIFNTLPVTLISILVIVFLWIFPEKVIKVFSVLGSVITGIVTVLMMVAVFQQVTGIMLPVLSMMSIPDKATGLTGLESGFIICAEISIVLAGAFPMMKWLTDTFGKSFEKAGKHLGLERRECAGMIAALANIMPMLTLLGKMGPKGKLLNLAFCVGGCAVFGDVLGFTAGVDEKMITPMIVGKLTAGIGALVIANLIAPRLLEKIKQ